MKKGNILIVDDEPSFLKFVSGSLQEVDYDCAVAPDAEAGLELLGKHPFDVVIIDLELPGMNGIQLLEKIKETHSDIVPILLSGTGNISVAVTAIKLGAFEFLEKPCHKELLIQSVDRAIAHRLTQQHLEEIRSAFEQIESTFEASPYFIVVTDLHARLIRCNLTVNRLAGVNTSELKGKNIHESICLEAHPVDKCPFCEKRAAGDYAIESFPFLNKLFNMDVRPLKDKAGRHWGWMFLGRDMTQLQKAQQDLKTSELRLKAILDSILTGVIVIDDITGNILNINPYALTAVGRAKEEIVGSTCHAIIPLTEKERRAGKMEFNRGQHSERRLMSAEGEKPILSNVTRTTVDGRAVQVMSFIDIGALKRTEEALRASEEKFRQIVENIGMGVALISPDMKILETNNQVKRWYPHIDTDQPQLCYQVFRNPPGKRVCRECPTKRTLTDGQVHTTTMETTYADKGFRSIRISSSPIHNAEGKITAAIEMIEDITDQVVIEQQLQQARKLESIGQLAAGIAHEINTPMQFISNNTRFLKTGVEAMLAVIQKLGELLGHIHQNTLCPEHVAEIESLIKISDLEFLAEEGPQAIDSSLEGIERITQIVRAMKDFSHPAGKQRSPLDINQAIENTLTVTRNEWKYVSDVETAFDPSMPLVPCFPGPFNQVLLCLIVNASQAIAEKIGLSPPEKGKIRISTHATERWGEVRIEDSGTGIPEAIRGRIFDPFFTTKEVGKGTGQGLSIAHSVIVQQHGGNLHVESEVGKGTTFFIKLPLHPLEE